MSELNYYEIIGLPCQPCVNSAELKANYLNLSSSVHPDRSPSDSDDTSNPIDASIVNEAHRVLSHIPSRLKYLLTLQTGSTPGNLRHVPGEIGELFMNVGALLQELDKVIKDKPPEESSELARVLFLKKSMTLRQKNESMLSHLNCGIDALHIRLERLNEEWKRQTRAEGVTSDAIERLTRLYHEWTFFDRWRGQLSQRLLELTI
jgi:curved DNA-binding protein CbpA